MIKMCYFLFHNSVRNEENQCWIAKTDFRITFSHLYNKAHEHFIVTQSFFPNKRSQLKKYLDIYYFNKYFMQPNIEDIIILTNT